MRIQALDHNVDEARIMAEGITRCDLDARVPFTCGLDEIRDRLADVKAGSEKMQMDEYFTCPRPDERVDCLFEVGRRELHVSMPNQPFRPLVCDGFGEGCESLVRGLAARAVVDDQ